MEKYKIKSVKDGSFIGDGGEKVSYFWVKAVRLSDGITLEFGSKRGNFKPDQEVELELEKTEKPGGGFRYKLIF